MSKEFDPELRAELIRNNTHTQEVQPTNAGFVSAEVQKEYFEYICGTPIDDEDFDLI